MGMATCFLSRCRKTEVGTLRGYGRRYLHERERQKRRAGRVGERESRSVMAARLDQGDRGGEGEWRLMKEVMAMTHPRR